MTNNLKQDISSIDDIERIVDHFYSKLMTDPAIGFYFTQIANVDLQSHLPRIVGFWDNLLLGSRVQRSNLFAVHKKLHDNAGFLSNHFDWWLYLFGESIDVYAVGPKADEMKDRAKMIGDSLFRALDSRTEPSVLDGVQHYSPTNKD